MPTDDPFALAADRLAARAAAGRLRPREETEMVTIVDATPAQGYGPWDHLFTGSEADGVVGRRYRTVAAACAAADRCVERSADPRAVSAGAHVRLTLRTADGGLVQRTT